MNRLLVAGVITLGVTLGLRGGFVQGQILHAGGERPSVEVVTIKPWKRLPSPLPPSDGASGPVKVMKVSPVGEAGQPTNRVHMILPAVLLVAAAYHLPVGDSCRRR